jgi:class 3 adenylate cyclase
VIEQVYEEARARFAKGDRIVQFVRTGGAAVFALVVIINGPVLGADPMSFTITGLILAALIGGSGIGIMSAARRGHHLPWLAYLAVLIDCIAITTLGVIAGGARTHLPTLLLVVVALNGLRLRKGPLGFAVGAATLAYLVMVQLGEVPERVDRQVVYIGVLWVMGMVAAGTVEMSRHLARLALSHMQAKMAGAPPPDASMADAGPPERRPVSIATIDLSGFCTEAATAPAPDVAAALGRARHAVDELARHHGGVVFDPTPGRLGIVFNAQGEFKEHARRAVALAQDLGEALQDANRVGLRAGLPLLNPAVGIQTGPALAGVLPGARTPTAVGDVVQDAAALADAAGPGGVALGTRTARKTGRPTEPFETRPQPGRAALRYVRMTQD